MFKKTALFSHDGFPKYVCIDFYAKLRVLPLSLAFDDNKILQSELLELVLHTHYPQLYKTKQNGDGLQQFYCHRVAACSSQIMTNLPKAFQWAAIILPF